MAIVERYRDCIQKLLLKYGSYRPSSEGYEVQLIFDIERDHYQMLDIGWNGSDRIYDCLIHLDIKNEKIWIQRNTTDSLIAEELVEMGVPKQDIILGLQAPYKRQYTEYGVA